MDEQKGSGSTDVLCMIVEFAHHPVPPDALKKKLQETCASPKER